ncbi:MAG: hypothetical protein ACRYFS_03830 [Janthinobacterium lividum]
MRLNSSAQPASTPVGEPEKAAIINPSLLPATTLDAIAVERPVPTEQSPQHLCLDKGDDTK